MFSKQYWHQRDEAKAGKTNKFGSYRYTAEQLYDRGPSPPPLPSQY